MVLIGDVKYACSTCIKGHRSSTCAHETRQLIEIKKKGRPVTQCVHCRELRKTKQVHVKCLCEGRLDVPGHNQLRQASSADLSSNSENAPAPTAPVETSCGCLHGGACNCCTPKHPPRAVAGSRTRDSTAGKPTLASRHSISISSSSIPSSIHCDARPTVAPGSLKRSTSLTGGGNHPHPQHHHAPHFAPYPTHHNHQSHNRTPPVPEEPTEASEGILDEVSRRLRSSSVSQSVDDSSRQFPPAPFYLNNAAAMSLPEMTWPFPGGGDSMSDITAQRSLVGVEYDAFISGIHRRSHSPTDLVYTEQQSGSAFNVDFLAARYSTSQQHPEDQIYPNEALNAIPRFAVSDFHFDTDRTNPEAPIDGVMYEGQTDLSDYDILATFLPAPPAASYATSGSGASRPPSMSGSYTSRSSSRTSESHRDNGLDAPLAAVGIENAGSDSDLRGRMRRDGAFMPPAVLAPSSMFGMNDPFNQAIEHHTTAIPSPDVSLLVKKPAFEVKSEEHGDGDGTQFPAWPSSPTSSHGASSHTSPHNAASLLHDAVSLGMPIPFSDNFSDCYDFAQSSSNGYTDGHTRQPQFGTVSPTFLPHLPSGPSNDDLSAFGYEGFWRA